MRVGNPPVQSVSVAFKWKERMKRLFMHMCVHLLVSVCIACVCTCVNVNVCDLLWLGPSSLWCLCFVCWTVREAECALFFPQQLFEKQQTFPSKVHGPPYVMLTRTPVFLKTSLFLVVCLGKCIVCWESTGALTYCFAVSISCIYGTASQEVVWPCVNSYY